MSIYYVAADGGGSKLQAILYDDQFRILKTGRVAGVNTLFKPAEIVRQNVESMVSDLLDGLDGPVESADLCLLGAKDVMDEAFCRFGRVRHVHYYSEPAVGLGAALRTEGVVALSGTGSDAFFVKDSTVKRAVGGWGPLLGDEGSGYDIGLRALKAAIYSYDGRREPSMLYDLVMKKWNLQDLWGIVTHLAGNPDARHEVASAALLCAQAAHAGDRTALRIYESAALEMSLQARTVIDKHLGEWDGTVVIMGGAWKGHPHMFDVFRQELMLSYPEARVYRPSFEPVVGCIVQRCLGEGRTMEEIRESILRGFGEFTYE